MTCLCAWASEVGWMGKCYFCWMYSKGLICFSVDPIGKVWKDADVSFYSPIKQETSLWAPDHSGTKFQKLSINLIRSLKHNHCLTVGGQWTFNLSLPFPIESSIAGFGSSEDSYSLSSNSSWNGTYRGHTAYVKHILRLLLLSPGSGEILKHCISCMSHAHTWLWWVETRTAVSFKVSSSLQDYWVTLLWL